MEKETGKEIMFIKVVILSLANGKNDMKLIGNYKFKMVMNFRENSKIIN